MEFTPPFNHHPTDTTIHTSTHSTYSGINPALTHLSTASTEDDKLLHRVHPVVQLRQCVYSRRQGVTHILKLALREANPQHAPTERQET